MQALATISRATTLRVRLSDAKSARISIDQASQLTGFPHDGACGLLVGYLLRRIRKANIAVAINAIAQVLGSGT